MHLIEGNPEISGLNLSLLKGFRQVLNHKNCVLNKWIKISNLIFYTTKKKKIYRIEGNPDISGLNLSLLKGFRQIINRKNCVLNRWIKISNLIVYTT
jgi:hypothetical protein